MAISEAKVEKETSNRLLNRREMLISLEFDGATPSREELKKSLADKFNLKQENLVVVRSEQVYGSKACTVLLHEYKDAQAMKAAQKHVLARPSKKEKKAAEAPKQEAAAPAQEKKAEAQQEKKEAKEAK